GLRPDTLDLCHHQVQHLGKLLMNDLGVASFNEVRFVAHAFEELLQFFLGNASQEAWVGNLVSVEVQNWQNAAVACRIEELVSLPTGSKRSGFGLAVADDARDDQVRIVEGGPISMAERVAEFAALVDAAGRLRRHVAWNATRETELFEQPFHPLSVLADVR